MNACLAVREGDGWRQLNLSGGVFRIGRDPGNDFAIKTGFISRNHCEVFLEDDQWYVRDLGSKLGTQVNGETITVAPLNNGDTLTCGHKFTAQFRLGGTMEVDSPTIRLNMPDMNSTQPKMRLVAENGPVANKVYPLSQELTRLGRHAACEIHIPQDTVSQFHAELIQTADGLVLTDLNSSNGTYINDRRIHRQKVEPGDKLRLDSIVFRFENENFSVSRMGTRVRGDLLKDLTVKGDDRISQQYPEIEPERDFAERVLVRTSEPVLGAGPSQRSKSRRAWLKWTIVLLVLGGVLAWSWLRWGNILLKLF